MIYSLEALGNSYKIDVEQYFLISVIKKNIMIRLKLIGDKKETYSYGNSDVIRIRFCFQLTQCFGNRS